MEIEKIRNKLLEMSIYFSDDEILKLPTVIGYEKKFKWIWFATQMNTFIVTTDFENQEITTQIIERHLEESFNYAKENNSGLPRGLQSGISVISVLISNNFNESAKEYCTKLKSGKKWAGLLIPVLLNSDTQQIYHFDKKPFWGIIYFPYFKRLISRLK